MDIYRSRTKDRDMRDLVETNKLYEVVKYYGGYLYYCKTPDTEEKTYNEFYRNKNSFMYNKFINLANAAAKLHFNKLGVSGVRMRRMLITKGGSKVRGYEWIAEYVEYILNKCMTNEELRSGVFHILQDDCDYCREQLEMREWKVLCAKRLLGFQYTLLNEVGNRKTKVAESALSNIHALENSDLINGIIESCPVIINK